MYSLGTVFTLKGVFSKAALKISFQLWKRQQTANRLCQELVGPKISLLVPSRM